MSTFTKDDIDDVGAVMERLCELKDQFGIVVEESRVRLTSGSYARIEVVRDGDNFELVTD